MGNPSLTSCWFSGNSTCRLGGGLYCRGGDSVLIDCTFRENSATVLALGGGMANEAGNATLFGCLFAGNQAVTGGGIYNDHGNVTLSNCTFAENSASSGRAVACDSYQQQDPGDVEMSNCILWNGGNEVRNNDGSTITITYSDLQGGWEGTGNIDAAPLFANSAAGDFHVSPGSPCIDAGDNTAVPPDITTDLDGNPRLVDDLGMPDSGYGAPPIVDMGAYEFQGETCFGSLDADNDVDLSDLSQLLANYGASSGAVYTDGDLDRDDDVDLSDLAALLAVYGTTCE